MDVIEPTTNDRRDMFTLKMAHYDETPEHFNVIANWSAPCPQRQVMRDKLRVEVRKMRGHAYWDASHMNVTLIAQDLLPFSEDYASSTDVNSDTNSDIEVDVFSCECR